MQQNCTIFVYSFHVCELSNVQFWARQSDLYWQAESTPSSSKVSKQFQFSHGFGSISYAICHSHKFCDLFRLHNSSLWPHLHTWGSWAKEAKQQKLAKPITPACYISKTLLLPVKSPLKALLILTERFWITWGWEKLSEIHFLSNYVGFKLSCLLFKLWSMELSHLEQKDCGTKLFMLQT